MINNHGAQIKHCEHHQPAGTNGYRLKGNYKQFGDINITTCHSLRLWLFKNFNNVDPLGTKTTPIFTRLFTNTSILTGYLNCYTARKSSLSGPWITHPNDDITAQMNQRRWHTIPSFERTYLSGLWMRTSSAIELTSSSPDEIAMSSINKSSEVTS